MAKIRSAVIPMRPLPWLLAPSALLAVVACRDTAVSRLPAGPPVERTVSAPALDSLPRLGVTDGHLVCLADGQGPCPVDQATANWVHDDRFATWEPNRRVQIWSPNQPDPVGIGEIGGATGQYRSVSSVAANGVGYYVIDAAGSSLLLFDGKGHYQSSVPIAPSGMTHAAGFAEDIPLLQLILPTVADSPAVFEVRELEAPGDTLGHLALKLTLPWLRIRDGRVVAELPLFPVLPSYAIAADSDIVWSAGDVFTARRQSVSGALRWSLTSNVPGPAVTPEEIAQARSQLGPTADAAAKARFDSSVAHTGKFHPAITGILLSHDDRVLIAGAPVLGRDSIDFYWLSNSGEPKGRFALPRRSRVLLFNGDSLLVQRPGPNMQQELRWLLIHAATSPRAP